MTLVHFFGSLPDIICQLEDRSMVECLARDRGVAGWRLTKCTAFEQDTLSSV